MLPFDNLSSDLELQYFSDDVSEEFIRRLSRGANIAVIGRASSFQFRAELKGEAATKRAPDFADACGRLAYLRSWLRYYEPYADRAASAAQVQDAAAVAMATDPRNFDALVARLFVLPPFGRFVETDAALRRVQQRGRPAHGLVPAQPRARRREPGRGRARIPDMNFPFANLLRARALLGDWQGVDRLLALEATRPLREFREGLDFIHTRRDPTPANLERWRVAFEARVRTTGCVDVSRLGLVEYWTTSGQWPDCVDAVPHDFRSECARVRNVAVESFGF